MEPEEAEIELGRIPKAQLWVVGISLAVPGIAAVPGWVYGGIILVSPQLADTRLWLVSGLAIVFLLLLAGRCIFAAWMLTRNAPELRRRFLWIEQTLVLFLAEMLLTPFIAGLILSLLMVML